MCHAFAMNTHRCITAIALILGLLLNPVSGDNSLIQLSWKDLVPPEARFDDPFTRLNDSQLYLLYEIAQIQDDLDKGFVVAEDAMVEYQLYIKTLLEEGFDARALLAIREDVEQERKLKTHETNQSLSGKAVRIPGYLLPLEFTGKRVTEFFLVPYVGACIHIPPPPPNQIIHVHSKEGFVSDGGLYSPVWVSGRLEIENSESRLSYVDGSSMIPSAYIIDASKVEVYE